MLKLDIDSLILPEESDIDLLTSLNWPVACDSTEP